jgi:hypothetical protein
LPGYQDTDDENIPISPSGPHDQLVLGPLIHNDECGDNDDVPMSSYMNSVFTTVRKMTSQKRIARR